MENIDTVAGKWIKKVEKTEPQKEAKHLKVSPVRWLNNGGNIMKVVHGRWKLEAHSFYRDTLDESTELEIYILASCSECNRKHPDSNQVFSKTLYTPEDVDDNFRFDQKAEQEKALAEFIQRGYAFANYCPNCGAKMDK